MLARSQLTMIWLLAVLCPPVFAHDDRWFFADGGIADAYRYQRQFGARLPNRFTPQDCLHGKKDFVVSYRGKEFLAPCQFTHETNRQLKELLESGAAKYLFPLDVGAARLAVPADVYARKLAALPSEEILPALLREPTLVAIYRTGMHRIPADDARESDASTGALKRIVVGYYDGRQNRLLPRAPDGELYSKPDGLVEVAVLHVMEHFLGELVLIAGERVVTFDLSFENAQAEAPVTDPVHVSAATR